MKKFLFSICALAAVVVGCSKSEVLNRPNAERPIEFNPYSGRVPETRAASYGIDSLADHGFHVYAFLYPEGGLTTELYETGSRYMNKCVRQKEIDGNTVWAYDGRAYWPATDYLAFLAYGHNRNITDSTKVTNIGFTVPNLVKNQTDLLVAAPITGMQYDEKTNNGIVNFRFSHVLSRIGFTLETKEGNDVPVRITKVNLKGKFYSTGTVDLTTTKNTTLKFPSKEDQSIPEESTMGRPYIAPQGDSTEITYELLRTYTVGEADNAKTVQESFFSVADGDGVPIYDNSMLWTVTSTDPNSYNDDDFDKIDESKLDENAKAEEAANKINRYMMLIPIKNHGAHLYVQYCLPGAEPSKVNDIDLSHIPFEAGKSYNFKFKVSTNGISFSVVVEDWDATGETGEGTEFKLS